MSLSSRGSLFRSTLVVSLSAAASRILGFVRDIMIAGVLGSGPAADAFLVAYRIPNLVRRVLTEGGLNAAFVPLYLRLRAESGGAAAGRFAADALAGLAVVLLALVALVELAAGPIVLILALGYADDPAVLDLATLATRLAFPFVAFATVAAMLSALLNAERRFAAAALAPLVVNALMIAGLAWLSQAGASPDRAALWLAMLVAGSGLAHLAIVGIAARRLMLRLSQARPRLTAPIRRLARLSGPALLASGAAQFIILAGAEAASFQPSAVSWFYYAERIFQLPLGFIGAAAGLVLLPELSAGAADDGILSERQNRALEAGIPIALPAALALAVLAQPMVTILFERGAFQAEDTRATAGMLTGLAFGLPFAAAGKLLSQSFFARGDLRGVVVASLLGMALAFAAALLLVPFLGPTGIGCAVALGFAAHCVGLALTLARRGWWRPDTRCLGRTARSLAASGLMAGGLIGATAVAAPWLQAGGGLTAGLVLASLCVGGIGLYGILSFATGALTRDDLAALRRR